MQKIRINSNKTSQIVSWAKNILNSQIGDYEKSKKIVKKLGCHIDEDNDIQFGFWTPERQDFPDQNFYLCIFSALDDFDFNQKTQNIAFQVTKLSLTASGNYLWGVFSGLQPGTKEKLGDLYWLEYQDNEGITHQIHDYLAYSLPFGSFAPAEVYDIPKMLEHRKDKAYFQSLGITKDIDGFDRLSHPNNLLQIHVGTATKEGTLSALTSLFKQIGEKISEDLPLCPYEKHFLGYEGIQLMPIEPVIEYENGPEMWSAQEFDVNAQTLQVQLRKPDYTNWGYDVLLGASSAINPAILETQRPDELLEFIECLHNFPSKPIKLVLDIVYGHIDNQGLPLLNERFFADANMYGQNVRFTDPVIRALLLEMQYRKHNYGVDGIRVDGAQDFKNWNPAAWIMEHDDDFLEEMNNIMLTVAGKNYRPWMIFEDGRPWPRDDWELASTYLEVNKKLPNVVQWGPLTFAHNTPFLFTFWISKFWRIQEMANVGQQWITGCANHDTLRRGTQVDINARVNTYLGKSLTEIFKNGYDNSAAKLFDYVFMPGIPMDFIQASMRAPWSFIRNTDQKYGVKVVSEESRFLYWAVDENTYAKPFAFPRLKKLGFASLDELRRFCKTLDHLVQVTDYNLQKISKLFQSIEPQFQNIDLSISGLQAFAKKWMDDVHEYCNISHYAENQKDSRADFLYSLRQFRISRPWLRNNLIQNDFLAYKNPCNGSVLFYGIRHAPSQKEIIFLIANMEGAPITITPSELLPPDYRNLDWKIAITNPEIKISELNKPISLRDSEGFVFIHKK